MKIYIILGLSGFLAGGNLSMCTPSPAPSPEPRFDAGAEPFELVDAGPAPTTPCGRACLRLVELGCPEGNSQCVATCEHVVDARLMPFSPACVIGSKTVDQARKCSAIRCEL